jgi:FMN-dependent NADH-azoreductase
LKKLLYISVNSKPEDLSTSKTVGREFVNRFLTKNSDFELEELDLYNEDIPDINYKFFKNRANLVTGADYDVLPETDKKSVDRINFLCDQFLDADIYVIAAPMWSLSFPSKLKSYMDCIILDGKVIQIDLEEVTGLLKDKKRDMVYIQSSGGVYPKLLGSKVNHGVYYVKDIFKFLGINKFEKILVEGIDMPDVGKDIAMKKAFEDVENVIDKLS